jgi:TPR repeat protein
MRCYAEVLLDGRGVAPDPKEASRLYSAAASLGDIPSKYVLADLYRRGIGLPAVDYTTALHLFQEVLEEGYLSALADLGVMHMNGQGTAADPARAVALWKEGAEKGDAQCMALYGFSLMDDSVGRPDPEAGKEWLRKAAKLEDTQAIQWLIENGESF